MVQQHFEKLFPGKVRHAHMAYDLRRVKGLVREYYKTREKLFDALDEIRARRDGKRPAKANTVSSPKICNSTFHMHSFLLRATQHMSFAGC